MRMREVQYIPQRDDWDCAVACLAMIAGCSYEQIIQDFAGQGIEGVGIDGFKFDWWWRNHGFATQVMTPEQFRDWPPAPWAPVHMALVRATRGSHVCVMDHAGRVLDPFDRRRNTLRHTDYREVRGVFGLWDISKLVDGNVVP